MARPVAGDSDDIAKNDNLPLPVVKYPPGSCFIGFQKKGGQLYFCDCAKGAIRNFIHGEVDEQLRIHGEVSVENITSVFQDEIREQADKNGVSEPTSVIDLFEYKKEVCHNCNQVVPKFRFCHEMYGTVFKQNYGWYIKQRQNEYGFHTNIKTQIPYVDDIPDELLKIIDERVVENLDTKIERLNELQNKRQQREREIKEQQENEIQKYLNKSIKELTPSERDGNYVNQIKEKYNQKPRLSSDEKAELEELVELLEQNWKRITDYIENEVRQEFGHHEIGSRWENETVLYNLINSKYGDEYTIKRHHRPEWLEGLELDIFIEEAQVGIEYQGQQHYEVVEAWGGKEGLNQRQARDRRTEQLCQEHSVELVEIRYDEEISEELVEDKIETQLLFR